MKIFVIAVLLLTAYAGKIETVFEEVSTTEFGKTLVDGVLIQMNSGESVDGLIESVRSVVNGLKRQMADAQAVAEAKHDACDADLREYAGGASQAVADQETTAGLSVADGNTLANRQSECDNKEKSAADKVAMLAVLTEQRQAERDAFASLKSEYDSVFGVIEDCRAIIQSRLVAGGDGFLQTNTGIQTALVERLNRFESKKGFGVFIQLMAKVVSKSLEWGVQADQAVVQNLFDIIDRIEENLDMAAAMERDAERHREEDFKELEGKINGQLLMYTREILDLHATISVLEDRIAMNNDKFDEAVRSQQDYVARLMDRGAECETDTEVWEQFYNNMSAELSTAGKLMYVLEDKRALLARYGL